MAELLGWVRQSRRISGKVECWKICCSSWSALRISSCFGLERGGIFAF